MALRSLLLVAVNTATSFKAPARALKVGDSYVWNVRSLNGSTSGPESNYLKFQIRGSAHPSLNAITHGTKTGKHNHFNK